MEKISSKNDTRVKLLWYLTQERVEEDIRKSDVMYGDSGKVDLGYYCFKFGLPSCKKYIIARVLEQKLKYEYGDALVHVEPI